MRINRQLLNPNFNKIAEELRQIQQKARLHGSRESLALFALIERKLRQLELTQEILNLPENSQVEIKPVSLHEAFRRFKLELRFSQRKWDRIVSNELRFQKILERRNHVSTCAA